MSSPESVVEECRRRQSREDVHSFLSGIDASMPLEGLYDVASTPQEQYEVDKMHREDDELMRKVFKAHGIRGEVDGIQIDRGEKE